MQESQKQTVMKKGIWDEIEELNREFIDLGIRQSVDYEKYYLYSLITHSTAIEGFYTDGDGNTASFR